MKNKRFIKHILLFLSIGIVIAFFVVNTKNVNGSAKEKAYEKLQVFTEVLSLVESDYVEKIDNEKIIQGAIKGMMKTLDPHSSYMTPDVYKEMQVETEGEFGGLGIEITIKDEQLTIVAPIDDTPADRAGLQAGDRIIRISGESTKDITIMEAVKKLRGPKNTKITITIMREDFTKPKDFTLTRDLIRVKSVRRGLLDEKIGYVRIRNFQKTTGEELEKALDKLEKENKIKGLVLDLRNNPGGLLQQAVVVSDTFLEGGQLIVYTQGRKKDQNMRFISEGKKAHISYPLVVLVNAGSASASEIVAGALQDLERAIIIGTTTFGKGSVQTVIPLSDGSGLRLTTAKYYTPKGRLIQNKGILPDILVENKPLQIAETKESEKKRRFLREKDLQNHLEGSEKEKKEPSKDKEKSENNFMKIQKEDLQLQRALTLLKGWHIFKGTLKTQKEETPVTTQ